MILALACRPDVLSQRHADLRLRFMALAKENASLAKKVARHRSPPIRSSTRKTQGGDKGRQA